MGWYYVYKTKDEQTTGFSCSALTLQIEWQEGYLTYRNPVVGPVSLLCERAPAHPGYPGSKGRKTVVVVNVVHLSCNLHSVNHRWLFMSRYDLSMFELTVTGILQRVCHLTSSVGQSITEGLCYVFAFDRNLILWMTSCYCWWLCAFCHLRCVECLYANCTVCGGQPSSTWTAYTDMDCLHRHGLPLRTWTAFTDMDCLHGHGLPSQT